METLHTTEMDHIDINEEKRRWEKEFLPDGYIVVEWAESQRIMEIDESLKEELGITLINDDLGLRLFGSSAFIISEEDYENIDNLIGDDLIDIPSSIADLNQENAEKQKAKNKR